MPLKVAFRTFGCKLNQAETESIASAFYNYGAVLCDIAQSPDVVVFNTCTVTSKAEQKARREIRLVMRNNPEALVIITGCYAELDRSALSTMLPEAFIIPGKQKAKLCSLAPWLVESHEAGLNLFSELSIKLETQDSEYNPFAFLPSKGHFHTRPQLKIQDGCNNRCSFCRVCLARGASVSLAPEQVVQRAINLQKNGAQEIVISGVNVSQYNFNGMSFSKLLKKLIDETTALNFRLSSYEPDMVDREFLEIFSHDRIRPHMHLSVQSGSDAILAKMRRHYTAKTVLEAVNQLHNFKGDFFLGADIITGFPSETDDDFEATLTLLKAINPTWVHVFPFSPRPGTEAFTMKNRVPEKIAAERAAVIKALAEKNKALFIKQHINADISAIVESCAVATSSDYLKLYVEDLPENFRGSCISHAYKEATKTDDFDMYAKFLRQL